MAMGMAMGRGGDGFYLPHPHIIFSCTYPLHYPYPVGMRNRISSPSPMGSGIPVLAMDNFFLIKIKVFFSQCCNALSNKYMMAIDDYGEGEERDRECEI